MPRSAAPPKSFEAAVAELETIVQQMEAGSLSLEDGLARYQRGMDLLKFCQHTLNGAEQRLRQLEGDTLTDLDHGVTGSEREDT